MNVANLIARCLENEKVAYLPTLKQALADDTVSVIACPVDYS